LDLRVGNFPSPRDLTAFRRLSQFSHEINPDTIHAHSSKAGVLARLVPSTRLRATVFYTPNAYFGMGGSGWLGRMVFDAVERVLRKNGMTINVSDDEATFARDNLGVSRERQLVIPNGIDFEHFMPATRESRLAWRARHGISPEAIVLGTIGRYTRQKDPLPLYRGVIRAMATHKHLNFAHLGDGVLMPQTEEVVAQAGLSGRFTRIPYLQDVREFLVGLDGFILSSRYEGLSFAVLEALAADLPLILSDVPGNRDFLRLPLSHCWSCPAGDESGIRDAVTKWLANREAGNPSNHRQVAVERFDLDDCCRKVVQAYRSAIEADPRD